MGVVAVGVAVAVAVAAAVPAAVAGAAVEAAVDRSTIPAQAALSSIVAPVAAAKVTSTI